MSVTATGHHYGKADITGITLTPVSGQFNYGPPLFGAPNTQAVYQTQTSGANGTIRWLKDELTPGVASRTTWAVAGS